MALPLDFPMASQGGGMFYRLSDEVLLTIMAKLPPITLVRMRAVCKKWYKMLSPTNAIKLIYRNEPIVHTPAFFIQLSRTRGFACPRSFEYPIRDMQSWVIEPSTGQVYKVPTPTFVDMDLVMPDYYNVLDACKNIYCWSGSDRNYDSILSLCNPCTNTWRYLPYHNIRRWNFSGMTFDPSTRHCTLLIGRSDLDRHIKIDIYDSGSNAWTVIDMDMPVNTVSPKGKGVYSMGKFYWMNMSCKVDILQFQMRDRGWIKIPLPQSVYFSDLREINPLTIERINYISELWDGQLVLKFNLKDNFLLPSHSWVLTGTDGRVVLVNMVLGCMWQLKEDSNEWCQLHILLGMNMYGVSVNSSGWTLAAEEKKMVVYDRKGRVVRTIEYSKLDPEVLSISKSGLSKFMWAFELNNVWWP